MARNHSRELDFGPLEKSVRWIEETPPASFRDDLERRLAKLRGDGLDPFLRAGALAACRSVRFEGVGRVPHGLLVLSSARSVAQGSDPLRARGAVGAALRLINGEIHHPAFGPYRLLDHAEVPGQGKEGTLFAFLEAVRAGETDWADHRFAWLVRNLEKDQVVDLLLSSGLECVTAGVHKVVGVVEVVSLLQALGWEWASIWLRPIVRHQASGQVGLEVYDRCREVVAERDLLRVARRRPPGQPALGERSPDAFLQQAIRWAEAEAPERAGLVADALSEGVPLEDMGDMLALGATLLFLQESLRHYETAASEAETDRRVHLVTGVLALRHLVRLGTQGQRILGLLLAGWVSPVRESRLASRSPDCGWWLPPMSKLQEPPARSQDGETEEPGRAWAEAITSGQANGLLPLFSERLEQGRTAAALEGLLTSIAPAVAVSPGLAMKLERSLADAYKGSRTPYRWAHLWASALALTLWPRESAQPEPSEGQDLRTAGGTATISTQG